MGEENPYHSLASFAGNNMTQNTLELKMKINYFCENQRLAEKHIPWQIVGFLRAEKGAMVSGELEENGLKNTANENVHVVVLPFSFL